MSLNTLITKPNLHLAWRRIIASKDARYKNFFRPLLEAYELSLDENIRDLRQRIKNDVYVPKPPLRVYKPKPSGLQRPLSLLHVEDQIVLQAITNLVAEKLRSRRVRLENKNIFSNKLGGKASPFFLEDWTRGYSLYRRVLQRKFSQGYVWVVKTDLSSFYDTIPHDLLMKYLAPRQSSDLYNKALEWLGIWSSGQKNTQHKHGVPQGPMASDFLAETILLNIDEKMSQKYQYFRYVDDVILLGKTELEARKALVSWDILCKDIGLIPNTNKTNLREAQGASDLVVHLHEIKKYSYSSATKTIKQGNAEQKIDEAIDLSKSGLVLDKALFRYVLFRAPASPKILKTVLALWYHYPEHTDAYISFLENYQYEKNIVDLAIKMIEDDYPYDYVLGELWKLVAQMGKISHLKRLITKAIDTVKNGDTRNWTRIGVQIFLCRCDMVGLGDYQKWLMYEKKSLIQALVAPYLNLNASSGVAVGAQYLSRKTSIDSYLGLVKPILKSGIQISSFQKSVQKFPDVAQHVFKEAGISGHFVSKRDDINVLLKKRYNIRNWIKWKKLLQGEYQHAYAQLKFADKYFDAHFSSWLSYQDTFNEIVFRAFQSLLRVNNINGWISLSKGGKLKDYGGLLYNQTFKNAFPLMQAELNEVHKRRNRLPNVHPYDKRTGKKAIPLRRREQTTLIPSVEDAINEIIDVAENLGI